jgi:Zn ribbon nucleic-acid-binding protein
MAGKLDNYMSMRSCIKCGVGGAEAEFQVDADTQFERIKRTCTNCGYVWYEAPLQRGGKFIKENKSISFT